MVKYNPPTQSEIELMQKFYDEGHSLRETQKQFGWSRVVLIKYLKTRHPKNISEEELKKRRINQVVSWRKRTKEKLVKYKGGKCQGCGYDKYIGCLDFHHVDPTQKDIAISGATISFERLKKEVDKCVLVCSNCHGEIHAGLRGMTTISVSLNYFQDNKRLLELYEKYKYVFGFRGSGGTIPVSLEEHIMNYGIYPKHTTTISFAAKGPSWAENYKRMKKEFPELFFEITVCDPSIYCENSGVKPPNIISGLVQLVERSAVGKAGLL